MKRKCTICKKPFIPNMHNQKRCSRKCTNVVMRTKMREIRAERESNGTKLKWGEKEKPKTVKCGWCRVNFKSTKKNAVYCSKECYKRGRRKMERERYRNKGLYTEYHRARTERYRRKLKINLIKAYGGKCKCCGEKEPEFLTVDHVYNDGNIERTQLGVRPNNGGTQKMYRMLRDKGYPQDRYQLLCFNCNIARSLFKICPHQRKKQNKVG